jgi:hypothetical protein
LVAILSCFDDGGGYGGKNVKKKCINKQNTTGARRPKLFLLFIIITAGAEQVIAECTRYVR